MPLRALAFLIIALSVWCTSYGTYQPEKQPSPLANQNASYQRSWASQPATSVRTISLTRNGTIDFSTNWSGYVVDTAGNPNVTAIWAKWVIPRISSISPKPAYSSDWIGIGGYNGDPTLIQAGTKQDIDFRGNTTYAAWYELIPASAVVVFSVSPGDMMAASIQYQGSDLWSVSIQDLTNGHSWSNNTMAYNSTFYSAEWIHEAASYCDDLTSTCVSQTLAKTSDVLFTDAKAIIGANQGSIGDFRTTQLILSQTDENGQIVKVLAEPSCLASRDRFDESYTGDLTILPPVLIDCSVIPSTARIGTTLTLNYFLFDNDPREFWLGASIRPAGTTDAINDSVNDGSVSVYSGSGWYSRQFYLQPSIAPGAYDWDLAIWSGTPGQSRMVATSGWSNGGLRVTSPGKSIAFQQSDILRGTAWCVAIAETYHSNSGSRFLQARLAYRYGSKVSPSTLNWFGLLSNRYASTTRVCVRL